MNAMRSDVLVLGGGVIGLSCALALLRQGASVRVLERGDPGSGASHGNCGTLTPSHAIPLTVPGMPWKALHWMLRRDAPLYVSPKPDWQRWRWLLGFANHCNLAFAERAAIARAAILQRSWTLLPRLLVEEGIECEYAPSGSLFVHRDARMLEHDRSEIEWLHRLGIAALALRGDEVEQMEPALLPGMAGGVLHADDAQLRPDQLADGLARRVRERGGVIETGTDVTGFRGPRGRVDAVQTSRGEFAGERVVVALGAWTPQVAAKLDLKVPIQPGKGYSITMSRPDPCPRRALVLREPSVCVTAWDSGYRLGSTMEFSGYDQTLNRTRIDALKRGAAAYLRAPVGAEVREEWWGWRPMSVDEIPLIGPVRRWNNVMLATGHGMLGVSMSAATAELVASLIADQKPVLDAAVYAPSRFGL
ncbi:MAG: FAD-dependent oxidoreductase [Xanthomonadales bacterium]|nr:FAD-dependent oxidoreductase [Xanthomonadales bacterium]ODU93360.1 MAG: amino acid dehydrogenase [Rhodanobacter sp. SCN 66-43]OJY83117.1 MAG: amino acid dehydrogenase [Xanthomonadales bacterium 66-474]